MKIKYKLILMFILIILFASLPVSLFILQKQEKEKIVSIASQGRILSTILAQSVLNIILANGGDIKTTQVDVKEMISVMKSLESEGLIYADAFLVSSKETYNGVMLASFYASGYENRSYTLRIPGDEVSRIKGMREYREKYIPGFKGVCYEFAATGALAGKPPLCIGRLIFSKSIVLAPIKKLNSLIYAVTALAILAVSFLGLAFSRVISKPIINLTEATRKIEEGELQYRLSVKSRDEIGMLSDTFNHMLEMINQKISELEQTNRRLTQLDVMKDEFLANVTHELKTPLSGIIGITESLMRGAAGNLNDEAIHDLSLIIASSRRLSALVNDILDFSKLKHHDIILNRDPVNMYDVSQLIISIMRPLIEQKALSIQNMIDPQKVVVNGDERRIQQIMLNILGNAIKFTDAGGIIISAAGKEDTIAIIVEDTGVGIPPDKIDRIFESFEQADGSITRSRDGSGLGLAITKKLVELHGGSIWAESKPGEGSRFTFTLERSEYDSIKEYHGSEGVKKLIAFNTMGQRVRPIEGIHSEGRKKQIIVVDDEPINLQVIVNHLSLEGYNVVTSLSGQEFLRMLDERGTPDLVLLDVMLPRISGYDICRKIREKYSMHELPVIMLTAKSTTLDVVTGLAAGANDYIAKPVNSDELIARVNNLISMKESAKTVSELKVIRNELVIAAEIQKSLVPREMPKISGIECAVHYEPSAHVGGDFYDYHIIDENRVGFFIADVAGHGIPAAMVAAMLKVAYTFYKSDFNDPSGLFQRINNVMEKYPHGLFTTACCIYIDMLKMKLYHSNAGHWPLIIWRRDEQRLITDVLYDRPIGLLPDSSYKVNEIDLHDHDRLILYTDGFLEARNKKKKIYSIERFHELIAECQSLRGEAFVDRVILEVKKWAGISEVESLVDDITLIVLDIAHKSENS
ncbi:MAG TPA: SpoIIE family protein phosphatase [Spirochaetota bacterium]|nr:SpoIIE family protein phosphatase [Spirochaetota bacterium]